MKTFIRLGLLTATFNLAGCGGSNSPVSTPDYDPEKMAAQAMKDYDKNGDGQIDTTELTACPALRAGLSTIDTNQDKKISAEELKTRFTAYKKGGAGAVTMNMTFSFNKVPLAGATVTFTPEAFMGGIVKVATTITTNEGGIGEIQIDGKAFPGLPPGCYRVSLSKTDGGSESIPGKYTNPATTVFGFEAFESGRGGGGVQQYVLTK